MYSKKKEAVREEFCLLDTASLFFGQSRLTSHAAWTLHGRFYDIKCCNFVAFCVSRAQTSRFLTSHARQRNCNRRLACLRVFSLLPPNAEILFLCIVILCTIPNLLRLCNIYGLKNLRERLVLPHFWLQACCLCCAAVFRGKRATNLCQNKLVFVNWRIDKP